ncbi:MAG: peptidoglycan-binding protein [Candidatus Pacebacteria bacterium]|nr:peptidoglycan-binding protein [Candidatus Paceibacterota bacterium]
MDQNTINILCHQQSKNLCPIRNYGYTVGDEDKVNKNNDIRIVQQLLSKTKKYHTGYYGKVTAQLIAAFQSKYKLNVTGVFTEETRAMMCKMLTGNTSVVSTVDLELASVSSSQGNKIKMDEKTSIVLKEKNNSSIELPVHSLLVKLNGKSATGVLDKLGVGQEREQELLSFVCDSPGDKIFEVFLDYSDNIKEIDEVNNIKQLVVSCDGGDDYGYECLIDKNYQCVYGKGGRIDDVEKCSESCVKSTELSKPDLLISKVERDGDKIKIYEENKGVVADKHFLEVKLSYNDQTIDFGKPVELPYMIKGERDFSFDFKCPADGVFNFKFNIDSTNVINESNELNNVFEKEIICGDVVDVSNIMYSCNKENGRCYISTENTVGDYLNIEDCVNNCTVDSDLTESKQGEGYCCDVENGQCTYYEDAKDRSQKGEPCCSEEGRCSELCAGLYEQKQQTTPEDKTEQKAYCCSVKEKRCIAYSPAEAVKLNKGGVFCSYDMQECSGACAKIIKAEEEKDLVGKPIMYFVENTNTKLKTTCAYNQIKIG